MLVVSTGISTTQAYHDPPLQGTSKVGTLTHCDLQANRDDQYACVVRVGCSDAFETGIAHQFPIPVME